MAISRSPQEFLKRKGIEPTFTPGPRFSPCDLLVHQYDTGQTLEKARLAEGCPPPARAQLKPWPPQTAE